MQSNSKNPFTKETQAKKELTFFAKFIKNREEELNISGDQLINRSHISKPTLWRIDNDFSSKNEGRYAPNLRVIQKLCFGLELSDDTQRLEFYDLTIFRYPEIIDCIRAGKSLDDTNCLLDDLGLPTLTNPDE